MHNRKRRSGWKYRRIACGLTILILSGLLSGCLYRGEPQERRVSYIESVDRVQRAVDRFQEDQGILPMITAGEETPKYEKFRVNLDQLNRQGYLEQIPETAFEKGGSVYFLVINEEEDPTVKVMDLATVQKVNDVQRSVDLFRNKQDGKLPVQVNGEISPGVFKVDLEAAGAEAYDIKSVYSGQPQDYLVDKDGRVYVDYAFDIMQALDQSGEKPGAAADLREILTDRSYFVPVKSLPYRWVDGTPVPQIE
ncbi:MULTISPECIES: DUF3939 domain-containing protein [Paenibacillus]|uniref:DUF3939 domain-containing protein n=1 Tax=Paenibacillus TaxID=44249 RepID=UPI002FE17B29